MKDLIKQIAKPPIYLYRAYKEKWLNDLYYDRFPPKPTVINLLANDICNSKCTMCNIWQQKQDFEFSPAQLEKILSDDLFTNITAVGITGGEPTLREDLPALYEAACRALPSLKGMSIITNAIRRDDVIERIEASAKVLKKYDKRFGIMVSLDGYGEIHDINRGRPGNFATAVEVINHFRNNTNIPVSVGCTITKKNVWHVDELLDWLQAEGIYGRFRIAEFIKRLYNDEIDEIRSFDADERYHLQCFFKRLQLEYETGEPFLRTYENIIQMLGGKPRQIGCPYHKKGVVLDSKGTLLYCAPKSKELGNTLKEKAEKIFFGNLEERRRLKREACSDCIHDYHAVATPQNLWHDYQSKLWSRLLNLHRAEKTAKLTPLAATPKNTTGIKTVYITGWYGTETVGDKAIFGGIIDYYEKEFAGKVRFKVSSIYPFLTVRTLEELNIKADIVPFKSKQFLQAAADSDITVMGGGPLMGMGSLSIPLAAFIAAKRRKRKTVVFGCGIGPLDHEQHIEAVTKILKLSDEIKLRDRASVAWGEKLTGRNDLEYYGDPAFRYLKKRKAHFQSEEKKPVLACFLRDWSKEYKGDMTDAEFEICKTNFEKNIAAAIKEFCREFHLTPAFYCMHTFSVGGDDRTFYRRFVDTYFKDTETYTEVRPSSVDQIARAMTSSSLNLCMRFHSVLFAHTLETNFLAIDYTRGGKIKGFLTDNNALDRIMPLEKIAADADFSFLPKIEKL